jgi:NAD(P)-dependent dehydrogenase (short-subunit alcohol dehydrogenase family)
MQSGAIAGRPVLVFGAGGALGAGVAAALAAAGAEVTGADKIVPPESRRLDGVRYEAVDVLDDEAVAALLDSATPWAVLNTVGGLAPARPLAALDSGELTGQLELNLAQPESAPVNGAALPV